VAVLSIALVAKSKVARCGLVRHLASGRVVVCAGAMMRSSSLVERPVLRLPLVALMGLALASRLALGAAAPNGGSGDAATTITLCELAHA
jgi:hypothetical protein